MVIGDGEFCHEHLMMIIIYEELLNGPVASSVRLCN